MSWGRVSLATWHHAHMRRARTLEDFRARSTERRDSRPLTRHALTLEDFRKSSAERRDVHAFTSSDAIAWVAVLFAVGGLIFAVSQLPGCEWLWTYGRLTLPLPLIIASWAFLSFRARRAGRGER